MMNTYLGMLAGSAQTHSKLTQKMQSHPKLTPDAVLANSSTHHPPIWGILRFATAVPPQYWGESSNTFGSGAGMWRAIVRHWVPGMPT